jgi:hypothetical protein
MMELRSLLKQDVNGRVQTPAARRERNRQSYMMAPLPRRLTLRASGGVYIRHNILFVGYYHAPMSGIDWLCRVRFFAQAYLQALFTRLPAICPGRSQC